MTHPQYNTQNSIILKVLLYLCHTKNYKQIVSISDTQTPFPAFPHSHLSGTITTVHQVKHTHHCHHNMTSMNTKHFSSFDTQQFSPCKTLKPMHTTLQLTCISVITLHFPLNPMHTVPTTSVPMHQSFN